MILQQLVWNTEQPETTELYYHTDASVEISDKGMKIPAGVEVRFDTYFNAFMAKTWNAYTIVENVRFRCLVNGQGTVILMDEKARMLEERKFCGRQEILFSADVLAHACFYIVLRAEKETVLESGTVEAEEKGRDVKLALVTCTFNRQKELLHNVSVLKKENAVLVEEEPTLEQIYVIDNASNLESKEVEGNRVSLIYNRNTGGAGGYTRGMQEVMKRNDLTHLVLMDDDVKIEFEAFRRTKSFLKVIRKEWEGNFLGGAMFRTDVPYILHAAGENWADGHIRNPYMSTDARKLEQVIRIAEPIDENQAYAGWWYCCMPKEYVRKKGEPIPFFLHRDDVEYSLRSGKRPIYLNGIALWHEEFEDKRGSAIEYYDVRNRLVVNALYKEKGQLVDALYILCERFYATVFRYRYRDFALSLKAVEDFLKGPEWLYQLDSESYHKTLGDYGYIMEEIDAMSLTMEYQQGSRIEAFGRYFLPASGSDVIRMGAPVNQYAGKKRLLLVEPKSKKGFEVKKSWKETWKCVGWLFQGMALLLRNYKKVKREWMNVRL